MTTLPIHAAAFGLVALLATLATANLVALWLVYQRLSRILAALRAQLPVDTANAFTQAESLWAVQQRLGLRHPLPRTRGWAASPDFLRAIMELALERRPQVVVECSSGLSTLVLARCAQLNGLGHVHTLEHDPEFAEKTRNLLRAEGLEAYATVHESPLVPLELPGWKAPWYDTSRLPEGLAIDLLVVDGPPWFVSDLPRYPAVPVFKDRLAPDAVVLLDDAARPEEQECARRWREDWPALGVMTAPACEKGLAAFRVTGKPARS
jgi:hypothetical protein